MLFKTLHINYIKKYKEMFITTQTNVQKHLFLMNIIKGE